MTKPWMLDVKSGDYLRIDPTWNRTNPNNGDRFPAEVKILDTRPAQSQSGILFAVRTNNNNFRELDAGWFLEPIKTDGR